MQPALVHDGDSAALPASISWWPDFPVLDWI